jgi:uncharacterized membrane protein YfcA
MEWWSWIFLAIGSVIAGVVNTLAGGGSLLTVPLLVLVGLSPNTANATNRIGVFAQSVVATWTFRREGVSGLRFSLALLPVSLAGAGLGAYAATVISDDAFRQVFGWIMLPVALVLFLYPKGWLAKRAIENTRPTGVLIVAFFFIGCYAGFIQAGYGLAALAALVLLGGYDLRFSNAVKVALNTAVTAMALGIFALRLDIHLGAGLVLAVGSGLGGYIGGVTAVRRGERWIRPIVLVMCVALSVHLILG